MWENRSRILFLSGLTLAALVYIQMGMYLFYTMMGWDLQFNFLQLCKTTIHSLGFSSAGYLLDALVLYTFTWAVWMTIRQIRLCRRFETTLMQCLDERETARVNQRYRIGKDDVIVVSSREPLAFTVGLLRRRIVLSTGLLSLLDEKELAAVIHHEAYHEEHADPLKVFLLSLLSTVFWYLPVLKHIHTNYKVVREVLADRHAMEQTGGMADLGRALLKLVKQRQTMPVMQAAHVSFADTAINYRIQRLLDPKKEVPFQLPTISVFISVSVIILLSQLFWVSMA
ncbi:M56 family metallopeptidase [Brevibacillus choshinensis]|uniref:M56 family metallopeptidase n=1 Tax=Brevibacillus choshinensis TaxID=54911 RepID=A0ABX7FQY7_BRECH|nr:M56 family metallopeptidase [Brevibacillus choshinensis]QRG68668.1 M56 family metallopeptidase [Brevibacillus choshinensis]